MGFEGREHACPRCGTPFDGATSRCSGCGEEVLSLLSTEGRDAPEHPAEEPAKRIGEFEILRALGRGGMGTVYLAHQRSMQRRVALKVLNVGLFPSSRELTRFEREAWIGGRLNHPNIVKVFAQGEEDGHRYIAMELVEGGSLHDEIERRRRERGERPPSGSTSRRDVRRMVELFVGVTDALAHVHAQGIIHRDLKPLNLLLAADGSRLLLTDFGLARGEDATRLTRQGDFMGTIRYMSPEQLLASRVEVDHRSDIYSLGVSLYEAVTLDLPYGADTEESYISAVSMKEPVPARKRSKAVSRDLETVLMKCLERNPGKRYGSAVELKDDLERFLRDLSVRARRPGVMARSIRSAKRHIRAVTAAFAVLLVMVFFLMMSIRSRNQMDLRREKMDDVLLQLDESAGRLSPDELPPIAMEMRDEFLRGTLAEEISVRLARALLSPTLPLSAYVDRNRAPEIYAAVDQLHPAWDLVAVVEATVTLDDVEIPRPQLPAASARPPGLGVVILPSEVVRDLRPGRHEVKYQLRAWFFHMGELEGDQIPDGRWKGTGTLWNPLWNIDSGQPHFGAEKVEWAEYWPAILRRFQHREVGPISIPVKGFYVVDELPPNYPTPVHSPELDRAMEQILHVDGFRITGEEPPHAFLAFQLRTTAPVPAPVAGIVEFSVDREHIIASSEVVIPQGWLSNFGSGADIRWDPMVTTALGLSFSEWRERVETGEKVPIYAAFRADREVAAARQGIDSFWDGRLEFQGYLDKDYARR